MTSDTVVTGMSVKVVNGVIQNIAPAIEGDEPVIDAGGGYLSPGLTDMHMHLWDRHELGLYLANGVTSVRNLLGMPFHLAVKEQINSGELLGPMFYTSSPQFTGTDDGDILKKPIESPEEAKAMVKLYKDQGYDYIKTYNLLPPDIFNAVLEQAPASDIPVIAHPSFRVDYEYHFNPLISTVEHTEDIYQQPLNYSFDRERLSGVVAGYARAGQTHCPTLTVFFNLTEIYNKGEAFLHAEDAAYLNPFVKAASDDYDRHMGVRSRDSTAADRINRQHNFHLEIVGRLHKAGVNIVCGTDAGIVNTAPGFSVHQELAFYIQAGMSSYEALKTATVNPSKVYDDYRQFGTVEKGKLANFILSEENPLDDLSTLQHPKWVMIKGRLIDQRFMEALKSKARQRDNYLATMIRVFWYIVWEK